MIKTKADGFILITSLMLLVAFSLVVLTALLNFRQQSQSLADEFNTQTLIHDCINQTYDMLKDKNENGTITTQCASGGDNLLGDKKVEVQMLSHWDLNSQDGVAIPTRLTFEAVQK